MQLADLNRAGNRAERPGLRLIGLQDLDFLEHGGIDVLDPIDIPDRRMGRHDHRDRPILAGEPGAVRVDDFTVLVVGHVLAEIPDGAIIVLAVPVNRGLVDSPVEWYGPARLVGKTERDRFPQSLSDLPVLLPTRHSALRLTLDHWFETRGLRPRIVGEFEDSALMAVFAARGLGVFPVSRLGADDVGLMRGLRLLGCSDDVKEEIHAIRSRRGQHHPLVTQVVAAARP